VLVDTGFQEDDVERRGIRNYVRPSTMVERMGVKVADIPIAIISHLHYDHWAGHRLFPASQFWIQKDEVAFWTGPFARYDAFSQSQNVGALTNLIPPDVFAPGNHEFDFGKATFLERMGEAKFPLYAANLRDPEGRPLPNFKDAKQFGPRQLIVRYGIQDEARASDRHTQPRHVGAIQPDPGSVQGGDHLERERSDDRCDHVR